MPYILDLHMSGVIPAHLAVRDFLYPCGTTYMEFRPSWEVNAPTAHVNRV